MIRAAIIGGSGYTGGELLRILLQHPDVEVTQATSESNLGKFIYQIHPHLRSRTQLRFTSQANIEPCDVLFLALPHGEAQKRINQFSVVADKIIDLSADFRLQDAATYRQAYGEDHISPEWLGRFVYGLPELYRESIRNAKYASGVGCNATASILALWALVKAGMVSDRTPLFIDAKVGSSEAGKTPSDSSHHPARSGVVRPFALTGHRHEAEVKQAFAKYGTFDVRLTVTSVELVRGVSAAVHLTLPPSTPEKDIWAAYRSTWSKEPFVRIVHEKGGIHRHPEPRLLAGTNYADVGWEYDPITGRAVLLGAIDNLGKGASGSAVQCMNLMCGLDELAGLDFSGIYP
jgi:N-acetyl-gamma-glutamyl-phosphate/LysW-gamma-L-alpha-aminoadipyl-6-phosphate reductase